MNSPGHAMPRVRDLRTAEQFTLWAIRSWVAAYQVPAPSSTRERLAQGFAIAGMPDGLSTLDEMLCVIAASPRVQIDVRCLRCRSMGDGEVALLTMIGAAQMGCMDDANDVLARCLPPASVRIAADAARRFAVALWAAGMILHRQAGQVAMLSGAPVSY